MEEKLFYWGKGPLGHDWEEFVIFVGREVAIDCVVYWLWHSWTEYMNLCHLFFRLFVKCLFCQTTRNRQQVDLGSRDGRDRRSHHHWCPLVCSFHPRRNILHLDDHRVPDICHEVETVAN